jgi:hypothetical protein
MSRSKRDAAVYNGIDQAKLSAGCRLGLDIIKHGANTPSIRKLRAAIEKRAAAQGEGEAGSPPSKTFTIDDWQIDVFLFSGFDKDVIPKRAIAAAGGDMRQISPAAEIREAAVTKGSAYDPLNAPYLLVVADCKEELPGGRHNGEALLEAVLGTIYTEVKISETGEQTITDKRKPDGYWGARSAGTHPGQRHYASPKAASLGLEDRPLAASNCPERERSATLAGRLHAVARFRSVSPRRGRSD